MKLPQLTPRDLFWLVALAAMGCGWWVERSRCRQYRDSAAIFTQLVEELEKRGVSVRRVGDQTIVVGPDSALALPPIGMPTTSTAPSGRNP